MYVGVGKEVECMFGWVGRSTGSEDIGVVGGCGSSLYGPGLRE